MERNALSLKEVQAAEYEILKKFRDFCEEYCLRYYLCGGTLLGAVRHHGFIPWDDDIDVMMPRPDYMQFLKLASKGGMGEFFAVDSYYFHNGFSSPGLQCRVYNMKTEILSENYNIPYSMGCAMDISVIDGLPKSKLRRWFHFKKMFFLARIHSFCITKTTAVLNSKIFNVINHFFRPVRPLLKAVGLDNYQRWMDELAKKHSYENCEYVGVVNGRAGERETMKKEDMEPAVTLMFEGESYTAMANYKEYLTNMYGDYMTPPPENQRVLRHRSKVFWRDLSKIDSSEKWWIT